jgi:hypothetical protein
MQAADDDCEILQSWQKIKRKRESKDEIRRRRNRRKDFSKLCRICLDLKQRLLAYIPVLRVLVVGCWLLVVGCQVLVVEY